MKMFYGNTPIKSLNVKHYEMNTNDCDMVASDLQAGKTAVAKGRKITGTGKSFEFARYGGVMTNFPICIPTLFNVMQIGSTVYPVRVNIAFANMINTDFSQSQNVGSIMVDDVEYQITVTISGNLLTISCDQSVTLEVFYGKDNYI